MKLTKRSENWVEKLKLTSISLEVRLFIEGKSVEIGYRATCGTTDQTRKNYDVFMKLVKSLKSQGLEITQEVVKNGNAYATNNGGFWNSYIFTMKAQQ